MKNLIIVFFLLFSFSAFGQLQKSSGVLYFNNKTALDSWGAPATYGGELAVTLDTHLAYRWNGSIWVEIDTQLSEVEVDLYTANNGYLTFEQDSSVNNELQTLGFFGTTLLLSDGGGSVDLSSLQDGTGTDDQTASEVNIADSGDYYTGTEVETALQEIGSDIESLVAGGADGDGIYDGDGTAPADTDVTITDSLSIGGVRFISGRKIEQVVSINSHLLPGGSGTFALTSDLYTDSDIDGTESAFTGWDKDESDDFDGVFSSLTSIPSGLSDGDDDTQLTEEQVEDYAGGMWSGNTETRISITYQDGDGTIDAVVDDDLANYDNTNSGFLTIEVDGSNTNEIQAVDTIALDGTTLGISLSSDGEAQKTVDLSSLQDGTGTDDQTIDVFNITSNTLNLSLESDGEATKTVDLSPYLDDTDTNLSQEEVEDYAGSLVASGSNSLISVTYNDAGSNVQFDVESDLSQYDNGTSGFLTSEVDGSTTNELQTIDTLSLSGTTLTIALENDGEAPYAVDLSSLQDGTGTDDQTIDALSFDGTNISISLESDGEATKTLDISSVDTDTQLSEEQVEDFVGGMVTGNTESDITVTYQDGDGTIDFAVDKTGDWTGTLDTYDASALLSRSNHTGTQTASTISDFDTEVSNNTSVAANTLKVTNATHTGDVTGSSALTISSTAITGKTTATAAPGDYVLIADISAGNALRKALVSDFQDGTGTDDQTASEVNITDSGGYYTGTEVETALSEIADTLGVHRTELNALSAPTVASLIPVVTDETISGSTKTLDCADKYSKVFDITNTGNYDCTLSIIKELDNATYVFHIHGMTAEVDIIFPTDYKKADASTNLGTVTASSDIFVTCYDTGSQLNCSVVIDQ
jgi:hypothetical protein